MKIIGVEGYAPENIRDEVNRGAKLVMFTYCISIAVMTFKRPSSIYFVRAGHSRIVKGLPFSLVSLLFGWWGIPWGPIYTIESLIRNFGGGLDVTDEVMRDLLPSVPPPMPSAQLTGTRPPAPPRVNKSALTLRQKLLGGGAVAAIALALYMSWCAYSAKRPIILLSGLPTAYTVELNGQKITLPPNGLVRIELSEGEFKLTGAPGNASETFQFETPFWSRPFNNQIAIVNPDKLGLFYQRNVIYYADSARPAAKDEPMVYTLFANQRVYLLAKPNYVFEEPPHNVDLPSGQNTTTHTALVQLDKLAPMQTCELIEKKLGQAAAEVYMQNLVSRCAKDEEVLKAAILVLKPEKLLTLLEGRLAERPLQINVHRFYQNLCKSLRPKFDLASQYADFAKVEPANGAFYYLQGRIQTDVTKSRAFYQQALAAPQPCAYAHLGLGMLDYNRADFEPALDHFTEAEKSGVHTEWSREAKQSAQLSLSRYDELLADVKRLRQAEPTDIELAVDEIRFTLLKTPEASTAKPLIESFCKNALDGWEDAEKPKARAYLEAATAYTLGNEKTFARKIRTLTGELFAFQAAVSEGDATAAAKVIAPDAQSEYHFMLYLVACRAGDADATEKFWNNAVAALRKESSAETAAIDFIDGKNAPTPEKICQLELLPNAKRVLLTALGVRFPQHRALFHDYAARYNSHPGFPHLLISSILKPPAASL